MSKKKTEDEETSNHITNLVVLALAPIGNALLLNTIPLGDPKLPLFPDNWNWIFIYFLICIICMGMFVVRWYVDMLGVKFSLGQIVVAIAVFYVPISIGYIALAYAWVFPVPGGSLLTANLGWNPFHLTLCYWSYKQMKARGARRIMRKLIAVVVAANLILGEFLVCLIFYNLFRYKPVERYQPLIVLTFGLINVCFNSMLKFTCGLCGREHQTRGSFMHFCLTLWYKTMVFADISSIGTFILLMSLDILLSCWLLYSFSEHYKNNLVRLLECCTQKRKQVQTIQDDGPADNSSSELMLSSEGDTESEVGTIDESTHANESGTFNRSVASTIFDPQDYGAIFDALDINNDGILTGAEFERRGEHAQFDTKTIPIVVAAAAEHGVERAEFIAIMTQGASDSLRVDQFILQAWAKITAPLYFCILVPLLRYGPNKDHFELNNVSQAQYETGMIYAVISFAVQVCSAAGCYVFAQHILKIPFGQRALFHLGKDAQDHIYEALFAVILMTKFVLLHSNANVFEGFQT